MNDEPTRHHGGRLIAQRLRAQGVSRLFTLSGGHLFSIYEGCRHEGIEIIDVRHEATAVFAAEGWAKVTREPGVAALTAGPGVTNGMSGMASALQNHSPIVVLGGRAPAFRWGQGSLQEIDHVPFVRPVTKLATTAGATPETAWSTRRSRSRAGRTPARSSSTSRSTWSSWRPTSTRSPRSPRRGPRWPTTRSSIARGRCSATPSGR
jgi:thiamine pyrophosphate-dependent enzyme